ncbi:MAG TPA: cytochrome c family protein [Anaerolineae bacterium]|nr:cytochrome c family protein [Anaerolineae bacterium]
MTTKTKKTYQVSRILCNYVLVLFWLLSYAPFGRLGCEAADNTYVGSDACVECHETEYKNFKTFAHKRNSFKSIKTMKNRLTDEEFKGCFKCHTTGYGEPGGFKSETETPDLKNAGCEVCHGPGGIHAETGAPEDINGKLTLKACETCHNAERVGAFRFKPLIYGGAH